MTMIARIRRAIYNLAVTLVEVGKPNDGVTQPLFSSGTEIDKSWTQLYQEFENSREAWRLNPMARRIISLTTGYVVGPGMSATSNDKALMDFITLFWNHPQNRLALRLADWSDELARAGELFPVLFPNPTSGIPQLRMVPASRIRKVEWRPGDYETEWAYNEIAHRYDGGANIDSIDGKWWVSPAGWKLLQAEPGGKGEWRRAAMDGKLNEIPWMLHYAVNRPVGAIRGEGDLAPLLTWLRRYRNWLEDRVRLNSAVRSFLWIVKAPNRQADELRKKYASGEPPPPGTMVVVDKDEEWSAVAPSLQARDASADGRAIRWMIAAGGPGTSLIDFGEGEDSNLATAKAAAELRRRFLLRRQTLFAWMLADLTAHAFNLYRMTMDGAMNEATADNVQVVRPDISVEDNAAIAKAAGDLVTAFAGLRNVIGDSPALRKYALRLFARYAEEPPSDDEMKEMLAAAETPAVEPAEDSDGEPPEEGMSALPPTGRNAGKTTPLGKVRGCNA